MQTIRLAFLTAIALGCALMAQAPLEDGYARYAPSSGGGGKAPGMKITELGKTARTFEVTMQRGDEVVAGLTEFAEKNHITAAHFTAVGAIDSGTLGWFDPAKRAYKKIAVKDEAEVLSLAGNIMLQNGKPFVHSHCVVGFSDGSTKGGHLIEGHVSLAMQIFVVDSGAPEVSTK